MVLFFVLDVCLDLISNVVFVNIVLCLREDRRAVQSVYSVGVVSGCHASLMQ